MQLYSENENYKLYCGDCIEVMKKLIKNNVKVNKIITSPPYNIIRPNSTDRGYDLYKDGMENEDYIKWTLEIFDCYDKILSKNGCIMYNMSYGTENTELMNLTIAEILKKTDFTLADIIVWKKNSATPNNVSSNKMTRICEFIYIFCRRSEFYTFTSNKKIIGLREDTQQPIYENVFNYFKGKNNDESTELNKATFSTDFVINLIDRYVNKDDIVMDNFSGTGTTIKGCLQRGIKCIGIELSEKQCKYSINRINQGIQTDIFNFIKE